MARRLAGSAHASVLSISALVGGTIVVVADALARTLFAPIDVPVGVMTALVGAPYFVFLLYRTAVGVLELLRQLNEVVTEQVVRDVLGLEARAIDDPVAGTPLCVPLGCARPATAPPRPAG